MGIHPFICKIYDVGESARRTFIVMEHVDGATLHNILQRGVLPARQVMEIASELAQALEEAPFVPV